MKIVRNGRPRTKCPRRKQTWMNADGKLAASKGEKGAVPCK